MAREEEEIMRAGVGPASGMHGRAGLGSTRARHAGRGGGGVGTFAPQSPPPQLAFPPVTWYAGGGGWGEEELRLGETARMGLDGEVGQGVNG